MLLSDNIRSLRKKTGMSQVEFAQKFNISKGTIAMWETGKRSPDISTILRLAEFFGVTTDALCGVDKAVNTDNSPAGIKIPVLGIVQAGIPIECVQDILDYEEITPELAASGDYFALKVRGSSMEPRIMEGDVVVVRQQPDVDSGDIAVVLVNGDSATVKKVVKHKNGISLVAYNPAFTPMFYTVEEITDLPVTILGKVIELRGKL